MLAYFCNSPFYYRAHGENERGRREGGGRERCVAVAALELRSISFFFSLARSPTYIARDVHSLFAESSHAASKLHGFRERRQPVTSRSRPAKLSPLLSFVVVNASDESSLYYCIVRAREEVRASKTDTPR